MIHSRLRPLRIINVPDASEAEAFVDLTHVNGRAIEWIGHSGLPSSPLSRLVRRPRLSRYSAAWRAVRDAQQADIIVSHLPRMTAAIEHLMGAHKHRRPHLAFSFNFTDLPVNFSLARMTHAFANVERFCVYSRYEANIYPELFNLPPSRFFRVLWAQSAPVTNHSAVIPGSPFVIAIGGEGRDYASILAAARARPDVTWLVIARPSAEFAFAPGNLHVRFNLPAPLTWGLAERAAAVVVPLRTAETCCGHITIASAQLLGLPVVTTRSQATREYVDSMPGTTIVEPGDVDGLASAAANALRNREGAQMLAARTRREAAARYDRSKWTDLVKAFIRDYVE